MSIPPLVCSTPPPPDQCEDDKDNEDFDIRYNLSQDDDEDSTEYDYGNYSSYNKFESNSVNIINIETASIKETNIEIVNEPVEREEYSHNIKSPLNNNTKDSDEIIEDLDLQFDQVSINSSKLSQTDEEDVSKAESNGSQKEELAEICSFPTQYEDSIQCVNILKNVENSFPTDSANSLDLVVHSDNTVIDLNSNDDKDINIEITSEVSNNFQSMSNSESQRVEDVPELSSLRKEKEAVREGETQDDNDFGDFDNFKCASSQDQVTTTIDNYENPWGQKESIDDFGNFKASFDEPDTSQAKVEHTTEFPQAQEIAEDDDFGDFDDFQTSSASATKNSESDCVDHESVFHLQSSETQKQEVEAVLSSIFKYDISDTVAVFEGKLESSLCETWGHLMDIDVRQPYMINWNNSLGQKTLLKALGIDSRNILFGPKWANNMPKYAANLSTAPLLPQKQFMSTSFPSEPAHPDRAASKAPGDTWVDPFTSDGKEFTYAEALLLDLEHLMATLDQMAHNHSTLKISDLLHACNVDSISSTAPPRPTDLEFEKVASKKSEKIYSTTLNIQPLRQINLPDTHIFTPTDSEIPRSKTIHYDSASTSVPTSEHGVNDTEDDYSDFQDFKASTSEPKLLSDTKFSNTTVSSFPSKEVVTTCSAVPYQTSLLQPIKLETSMPTLNWPDPGQVKETFEDFSDFISSTSWQDKQDTSSSQPNSNQNITPILNPNSSVCETSEIVMDEKPAKQNEDDEFDTFQSAIPPAPITSAKKEIQGLNITSHNDTLKSIDSLPTSTLNKLQDPRVVFSGLSDLTNNMTQSNTSFNQPISQSYIPNNFTNMETSHLPQLPQVQPTQTPVPILGSQMNVLQPSRLSSSVQSKPASGQILQPLSLEGYSQINWPNPGDTLDLTDLSRFNPVETLPSLKGDLNPGSSKTASPAHSHKSKVSDDDWGDFVSSEPKQPAPQAPQPAFVDNDEWTDFFSCSTAQPHNGLNTISLNVHTNLNIQKTGTQTKYNKAATQIPLDIPKLNYVTPKTNHHRAYSDRHFQNL